MKVKQPFGHYSLPLVLAIVSALSMIVGMRLQQTLVLDKVFTDTPTAEESAIYEASQHIMNKYYGEVDRSKFTDNVISEMAQQLDPYSRYFPKEENGFYDRFVNGIFSGIGIQFKQILDTTFISKVIPHSPADSAGLERGDLLVSIDGIELISQKISVDSILSLTDKDHGEEIALGIIGKDKTQRQLQLKLTDIDVPMIEYYRIQDELGRRALYIHLKRIYENSYRDLMSIFEEYLDYSDNIILDLRDNPGGVVEEAVKMLNQFIQNKGQLLLSTRNNLQGDKMYKSNGRILFNLGRVAILCNRNTASSSEIIAGGLQDYNRAVIIGERTFGKGLIQQNYDLSNGGSLSLTIGEYVLPSGRSLYDSSADISNKPNNYGQGIPVDTSVVQCPMKIANLRALDSLLFVNKLWNEIPDVELINEVIILGQNQMECIDGRIDLALWTSAKNAKPNGSELRSEQVDVIIQSAHEILHSSTYTTLVEQ